MGNYDVELTGSMLLSRRISRDLTFSFVSVAYPPWEYTQHCRGVGVRMSTDHGYGTGLLVGAQRGLISNYFILYAYHVPHPSRDLMMMNHQTHVKPSIVRAIGHPRFLDSAS